MTRLDELIAEWRNLAQTGLDLASITDIDPQKQQHLIEKAAIWRRCAADLEEALKRERGEAQERKDLE